MRKGFSLITAIVIMMAVSLLMTMMISLSSTTVKTTTDMYLKEQANLLARSAVEYVLLAISGHNNTKNCITNLNLTYPNKTTPTHDINVSVIYLGKSIPNCTNNTLDNNISTDDSNFTAIVDVIVSVRRDQTGITEPIRIHRRTIQKP